jgi:hypothetical protein
VMLQATVTLLARLDEAVAARGRVKEGHGLVAKAVVHAVFEGESEILLKVQAPNWGKCLRFKSSKKCVSNVSST